MRHPIWPARLDTARPVLVLTREVVDLDLITTVSRTHAVDLDD